MRILYSYEEAFAYSKQYIQKKSLYPQSYYDAVENLKSEDPIPKEARLPIWKMDEDALANTLKYVFKKLHHNCYLLCVKNREPVMFKLESLTTAPSFKEAIEKSVSKLDENPHIDESQRKYIREFVSQPVRVMQCIVKKYKSNEDVSTTVDDLKYEGAIIINDPVALNSNSIGLSSSKSPGIFIGTTRAFSSDNNPWSQVGTALSTSSSSVSLANLYFANDINITGISTESATQISVTNFTHKMPIVVNGETYYLLLST